MILTLVILQRIVNYAAAHECRQLTVHSALNLEFRLFLVATGMKAYLQINYLFSYQNKSGLIHSDVLL
ncbi:hypothetical protein GCM10026987_19080 [Belliella aquatica]|uniref:Transposase n=1 Tax=Belliella aquatica TaxID=1323734 RepID=A0ABQ1MUH6_9BACT|nr:hypothetical protein GCM10010993_22170 [Belliella aquatica]